MRFKYWGVKPEVDGSGFNFRVDQTVHTNAGVLFKMNFMPDLAAGYEVIAIPESTPYGWIFKHIEDINGQLSAFYEPLRESIDPRDEKPNRVELRIYIVKTVKQEYIEDERQES